MVNEKIKDNDVKVRLEEFGSNIVERERERVGWAWGGQGMGMGWTWAQRSEFILRLISASL